MLFSSLFNRLHKLTCLVNQLPHVSPVLTNIRTKFMKMSSNVGDIVYPQVRRDETQVETHFGHQVHDPYRWLEDNNGAETEAFVKVQNEITEGYLSKCAVREKIKETLTKIWDYPKYSTPYLHAGKCFYYYNSGLENQSIFYVKDSLNASDSDARVFLNPNTLSTDGTVSLEELEFSKDEKLVAYGLSSSGSDWYSIHFMDVETQNKLDDVVNNVKFSSIAWTHDNKGVFYSSYADNRSLDKLNIAQDINHKVYYHKLGTAQSEDVLVYDYPEDEKMNLSGDVSDCGKYYVMTLSNTCKTNMLYVAIIPESIDKRLEFVKIIDTLDSEYKYVGCFGGHALFRTNRDAKNYRLIGIDLQKYDEASWIELIPNTKNVLESVDIANEKYLVVCYQKDVLHELSLYELSADPLKCENIHNFNIEIGSVCNVSTRKESNQIFYHLTSFLTPGKIYHCDLSDPSFTTNLYREVKIANIDLSAYEVDRFFYQSYDKTMVPIFIVRRNDHNFEGDVPCILYGYGGFNISILPTFSINKMILLNNFKGVYAVANIRGGGEYGDEWHDGGKLLNKQNCFDDFHAAAEYLIGNQYTNAKKLVIEGGSNGGLLVAACINQRPDLYAGAIAHVGVLDMLRFHKFTIGSHWICDYGTPDNQEQFEALFKYSPYHNVGKHSDKCKRDDSSGQLTYPATLLLTADHDDRVVPAHSFKYIAALQNYAKSFPNQKQPLLIRIDSKAGHGGGKPTGKLIDEKTDIYAFLVNALDWKFYE